MATAANPWRPILRDRFDAAITAGEPREVDDGGKVWRPTELGERLAVSLIEAVCKTAPEGELGTRAYFNLEHDGLDHIMADVRRAIVREVERGMARPLDESDR